MSKPLMRCGHVANAVDEDGSPVCAICAGLTEKAFIPAENPPALAGRKALCPSCGKTADSSLSLPFFGHRPNDVTDWFYCGCAGWD